VLFKERYEDTKGAIKNDKSKIPKKQSKTVNLKIPKEQSKTVNLRYQRSNQKR
jgi:hypothetical protein